MRLWDEFAGRSLRVYAEPYGSRVFLVLYWHIGSGARDELFVHAVIDLRCVRLSLSLVIAVGSV